MNWPVKVYSVDEAVEKAKHGSYPFEVKGIFAPLFSLGSRKIARNEDELRDFVQKALEACQIPLPNKPEAEIEPA